MTSPGYMGVILAAGRGSRMGPFGDLLPKPILPICNRPLLAYQLGYMRQIGIEHVVITIGHLGYRITQEIGDGSQYGVQVEYVEQRQPLGIAHALGQLERYVNRPFVLMLGDIFFELSDPQDMVAELARHRAVAVIGVKEETDPEAVKRNFAVLLREDGTVRRVIEKPRHAPSLLKGCGVYVFDLPIFDAIRRTPRTALRDEYELTDSIQMLIDYDYPVRVSRAITWDVNITYVGDLITCCVRQLANLGVRRLEGIGCSLAPGTDLCDTVLGDRVIIKKPVRLERCVVLSDVVLDNGQAYSDMVFTRETKLRASTGV